MDAEKNGLPIYETELARLLKVSTLTPGSYVPSAQVKAAAHAAVFAGDAPIILCGPSSDPTSVRQAEALAANSEVRRALRAAGLAGDVTSGYVYGPHVPWAATEAAIVSKPSGQLETGGDDGPLIAIVLNDPNRALATRLCVTTSAARVLDANAPELENGA